MLHLTIVVISLVLLCLYLDFTIMLVGIALWFVNPLLGGSIALLGAAFVSSRFGKG